MKIEHNKGARRFELFDDSGEKIGEIEYMKGGNNEIYATHTEVYPQYEGRGFAARLLDEMADFARQNKLKIVPVCPYVISAFKKYPEKYGDIVKK